MPIITISRGSYYHAKSISEKLARKLNFKCISRDQVVKGLDEFHLPEIQLQRGLNDAFSVLDRFPHGKKRFIAAIKSALLQHFMAGNVVYHGLVGHHFVRDIPHVLKVRIIADTENRVAGEMARENISEEQARFILKKDDEERRKWAMFLYGIDIHDPETYNLTIRIGHLSEDEAVDIIAQAVALPSFQETTESEAALVDSAVTAMISKKLFDFPNSVVVTENGRAVISFKAPEEQQITIKERISEVLTDITGLEEYSVQFDPYF